MKRILTLITAMIILSSCFSGCSSSNNSSATSSGGITSGEVSEAPLLNENEIFDSSESDDKAVLKDGEFDPMSIVADEYITYGKHYYNGDCKARIVFPEDFEIEIVPNLYLKTMVRNSSIDRSSLDVIMDNQLLGTLEYYFVGEILAYEDISKLTEGDIIELVVREHEDSDGLEENLTANGYSWVASDKFITVPDLGELFESTDEVTRDDIDFAISTANEINSTYFLGKNYTVSESPKMVYKGTAKSPTVIGDAVKIKLVFERTHESGKVDLYVLTTEELAKHEANSATCYIDSSKEKWYEIDISEQDMIANWDENYTWERIDY